MQILYTANATATGGRDGQATSNDQRLTVKLSTPKELGGAGGEGTNPEQLFAEGYLSAKVGDGTRVSEALPESYLQLQSKSQGWRCWLRCC